MLTQCDAALISMSSSCQTTRTPNPKKCYKSPLPIAAGAAADEIRQGAGLLVAILYPFSQLREQYNDSKTTTYNNNNHNDNNNNDNNNNDTI